MRSLAKTSLIIQIHVASIVFFQMKMANTRKRIYCNGKENKKNVYKTNECVFASNNGCNQMFFLYPLSVA